MKRIPPLACLLTGLLLLAGSGPLLADPPPGGSRDRHGDHRGQPDRRDWRRGPDRDDRYGRNSAQRRPLGTSHDDHDRYRYDRDARRAAEAVRRDERGRVLSSQPTDDRGYRVRVLTPDGYVRERYVDPRDAERGDARRHRNRD